MFLSKFSVRTFAPRVKMINGDNGNVKTEAYEVLYFWFYQLYAVWLDVKD